MKTTVAFRAYLAKNSGPDLRDPLVRETYRIRLEDSQRRYAAAREADPGHLPAWRAALEGSRRRLEEAEREPFELDARPGARSVIDFFLAAALTALPPFARTPRMQKLWTAVRNVMLRGWDEGRGSRA